MKAQPITVSVHFIASQCLGGHDFAVGQTFAVCNRCERVIPLEKDEP